MDASSMTAFGRANVGGLWPRQYWPILAAFGAAANLGGLAANLAACGRANLGGQ